jgi:hypothetical protein
LRRHLSAGQDRDHRGGKRDRPQVIDTHSFLPLWFAPLPAAVSFKHCPVEY